MEGRLSLLVIDDDDLILKSIQMVLPAQWDFVGLRDLKDLPTNKRFDAAFVDLHLTGDLSKVEGLKVIEKLIAKHPHLDLVAISGNLDRNLMESCLKAGASRFLAKPLSEEEIQLTLAKVEALILLQATSSRPPGQARWIGTSPPSQEVLKQIALLKGEPGPILIEGESGTGKEIVSRLLHNQEDRRPFIQLNVAAVPDALFESEFFGHLRGSFTGAEQNKMGLAEAAHGGDLFLDELEALSPQAQVKLLRFLETGEVRRVGSKDLIHVNTRVIAASNQNLEPLVKKEKFREDLFYRLNGKRIRLPPLRNRLADIKQLSTHFLEQERPRRKKTLDEDALATLVGYDWPGNVRELKRVLEQASLVSPLPIIRGEDLLPIIKPSSQPIDRKRIDLTRGLANLVEEFEKMAITDALKANSDVDEAARTLKISRSSLYKKIKDYDINVTDDRNTLV
jgi:DNA-binding NtrC family response regulator